MDDKINIKDYVGYFISAGIFVLLFFVLPTDRISYTFGLSDSTATISKILISLILSIAIHFGLQYILYPKSKAEVERDFAKLSYSESLKKIQEIASLAEDTIQWVTKEKSAELLRNQARMLTNLHIRFEANEKAVELNRFILLMQEYVIGLTTFAKVMNPDNFFTPKQRRQEVEDTEDKLLPMAEAVLFNIGSDFDHSVLLGKNVADGAFASLAKSFSYLQSIERE